MNIKYHDDLIQGSDEWKAARCGLITASEMKLILTPTGKVADNDKSRAHLYELAAQRINNYVEPSYVNDDMMRGTMDEPIALNLYEQHYELAQTCGFITNNKWGFTLGYSPDGVVGDGLVEIKSRKQRYQLETIISNKVPDEYHLQIQTGLLVSEREWLDFISYSGGMPMFVQRVLPDAETQERIIAACTAAEGKMLDMIATYEQNVLNLKVKTTERTTDQEIII